MVLMDETKEENSNQKRKSMKERQTLHFQKNVGIRTKAYIQE